MAQEHKVTMICARLGKLRRLLSASAGERLVEG